MDLHKELAMGAGKRKIYGTEVSYPGVILGSSAYVEIGVLGLVRRWGEPVHREEDEFSYTNCKHKN